MREDDVERRSLPRSVRDALEDRARRHDDPDAYWAGALDAYRVAREEEGDVGDILATVAHELRSPLAVIRGFVESLVARPEDPRTREVAVGALRRNLDLLGRLVDGFGAFRHIDDGRFDIAPEPVEVGAFVEATVADLRGSVLRQHPTRVDLQDEPLTAAVDPARLSQVLFNLLSNAARYSAPGAEVIVTVRRSGDDVEIVVRDHGFGVAPEDVERIFEKFTRLDPGGGGVGLGLYLSRAIARTHGGDLNAEPAEVEGSRFVLRLPLEPPT